MALAPGSYQSPVPGVAPPAAETQPVDVSIAGILISFSEVITFRGVVRMCEWFWELGTAQLQHMHSFEDRTGHI